MSDQASAHASDPKTLTMADFSDLHAAPTCARCGGSMRLAAIEPVGSDRSHAMFDCACGSEEIIALDADGRAAER
jgi:hypothetical protein